MKKFIAIFLLLALAACASHYKGVATPEEVNDYLNKIAERSNFDPLDWTNNDNVII